MCKVQGVCWETADGVVRVNGGNLGGPCFADLSVEFGGRSSDMNSSFVTAFPLELEERGLFVSSDCFVTTRGGVTCVSDVDDTRLLGDRERCRFFEDSSMRSSGLLVELEEFSHESNPAALLRFAPDAWYAPGRFIL